MKDKVFIFADSWGSGEWKNHKINHLGLESFFHDIGYTVMNYSIPGGSNNDSIRKFKSVINDIGNNDYIFFITTDATRDLPYNKEILTDILIQNQTLPLLIDKLLDSSYNKLNELCSANNLNIYMIGGLSNLDSSMQSYKNLIPIVPSWINLLVGHFDDYKNICDDSKFRILSNPKFTINNINLTRCPLDVADKLIEDFHLYQESNSLVFREEIFRPDGVHPNKEGHRILFETLLKKL
jgi:hypothetical protein